MAVNSRKRRQALMSLTGLAFLGAFLGGLVLALARHPLFGLYTYVAVFYLHPPSRWWANDLPDLRWALLAAAVTLIATLRMPQDTSPPKWHASTPAKLLIVFLCWIWVQNLWALNPDQHLELSILYTKYIVLFYLIFRLVKDWHVGAGFFPNYALDHHGYFNVGYMAICLSNAAMLHFDLRAQGLPAPESLYWHNADLWRVLRRLVFGNGRLARLGGDSRIRYVYCQEFLLPTLAYAEDALGERFAAHLTRGFLEMVARDAAINKDGSFYGKRLDTLLARSPYYYTRLESDRACALAMLATYIQQTPGLLSAPDLADGEGFEADVAGIWCEPEHGDVLHRSPQRLASFAWRAHGLTQGMCQPPDDGHLAEWQYNLAGVVRFLGDDGEIASPSKLHRRLEGYEIHTYDGGFCTCGAVTEGIGASLPEQYVTGDSALHQIAFAALPDGNTVVGLQHCRTLQARAYLAEVKGLLLNVPNDLYNAFRRRYQVEHGEVTLACPPKAERVLELGSRWVNVDGSLGVAGIYGAEQLVVHQSDQRRGGRYHSLYVDQVCWHCAVGTWAVDPGTTILDVGWAVLSGLGAEETRALAQGARRVDLAGFPDVRAVAVTGTDGRGYTVVANFGAQEAVIPLSELLGAAAGQDLISGDRLAVADGQAIEVGPQSARVLVAL